MVKKNTYLITYHAKQKKQLVYELSNYPQAGKSRMTQTPRTELNVHYQQGVGAVPDQTPPTRSTNSDHADLDISRVTLRFVYLLFQSYLNNRVCILINQQQTIATKIQHVICYCLSNNISTKYN